MEIVYAFVGRLPSYIIETIHQARLFSTNKITLICDDIGSPFLEKIAKYNVNVVPYTTAIDTEFLSCLNTHNGKFCIADKLGDRRLLFIRSFERFFLLQKYMEMTGATNVLFLELDVLIYFKPSDVLSKFSEKEITFEYTDNIHNCSGFCYIKSVDILKEMNKHFLDYIIKTPNGDFISEMRAIKKWTQEPSVMARAWMLPGLWKDERYHQDIWREVEEFDNCLYDGSGIGALVDGPDATHRDEWERKGRVWWGTEVNYSEVPYLWKTIDGFRYLYLVDKKNNNKEYKVNCIHVHNKNLPLFLSRSLSG